MLQNTSAIQGYAIAASDGRIGTVSDFLFDDSSWLVRWLVVDTGNWLSGRKVLLPPSVLGHLDPKEEQFLVRLTMQQVRDSPDIDSERPVSRQIETNIYDYYGWRPYWGSGYYMGSYAYIGGGYGFGGGAMAPLPSEGSMRRAEDIELSEATTIRISAAPKRSPGIISMPAMARSATLRTSSWRRSIGVSITSSSTRRTGGLDRRF